jgi:hypothetical protein
MAHLVMMFVVADRMMMRVMDRMMVIGESAQRHKGGQAGHQDQRSQHATNRHERGLLESIERIADAMGATL